MKQFVIYLLIALLSPIIRGEETTPHSKPLTDPSGSSPPEPHTNSTNSTGVQKCVSSLNDIGGNLILDCEGYMPPDLNFSTLITDTPPSHRRWRRESGPCLRRKRDYIGNETDPDITWSMMHPKIKFCIQRTANFMRKVNDTCIPLGTTFYSKSYQQSIDPSVYAQQEGCIGPLLSKGLSTVPSCASAFAIFGRRRKRSSDEESDEDNIDEAEIEVKRRIDRKRMRRSKCFYGFFDIFTGGIFGCVKGAIGIATHILEPQCLNIIP